MSQIVAGKLKPRERRALLALLSEPTISAAAQAVGLSRRTIQRYLTRPEFRAELDTARIQAEKAEVTAYRDVLRQRLALAREAVGTLAISSEMRLYPQPFARRLPLLLWRPLSTRLSGCETRP